MKHRPDIDGLRAIAVGAVVLLHAGVPGFSGGFVGVDVFFVISGYLITKLLLAEMQTGGFSIANFYERRARRILPALFTLLFFTSAASYKLLLPDVSREFGKSVIATVFFSSNVFFAGRPEGYFHAGDTIRPLLHTWSLAVEEQFYILYPLYLLLVTRYIRKRYAIAIGVAACVSFAWSMWAVSAHPWPAFYAAPGRAWELLIGALLAAELIPSPKSGIASQGLGLLGLALILYSMLAFSAATTFPGPNAMYPCLGAVLIIYAGGFISEKPVVTRLLSTRPMVFIGLISYSLYLWHWVLIVFAKYYAIRPLTAWETSMAIVASVLAGALSWKFIENPFRGRRAIGTRTLIFAGVALGGLLFTAYGSLEVTSGGFPRRFNNAVLAPLRGAGDIWPRRAECANFCQVGTPEADPSVLLWGDSHAGAIAPMIDQAAQASHLAVIVAVRNGCAPLLNLKRYDTETPDCAGFNDAVLNRIKAGHIKNILLHARWARYADGKPYKSEGEEPLYLTPTRNLQDNCAEFDRLVRTTFKELRRLDLNVVIMASVPEVEMDVPSALARAAEFDSSIKVAPGYAEFMRRQACAMGIIKRWAAEYSMKIVYPHEILCNAETCSVTRDGWDLYIDSNHLSLHGAMDLKPLFQQISADWQAMSKIPPLDPISP